MIIMQMIVMNTSIKGLVNLFEKYLVDDQSIQLYQN